MWASGGIWFVPTSLHYIYCIGSLINYRLETFTTYTWQRDDGPNIQTITEFDDENHIYIYIYIYIYLFIFYFCVFSVGLM
jgi:hypothetical protein